MQIKLEAARRKALREAKRKEQEALQTASKTKTAEEVEAELQVTSCSPIDSTAGRGIVFDCNMCGISCL